MLRLKAFLLLNLLALCFCTAHGSNEFELRVAKQTEKLKQAEEASDSALLVSTLVQLSQLELTLGNYPLSLKHLTKAESLQVGDPITGCEIQIQLSKLFLLQENLDKAQLHFNKAQLSAKNVRSDSIMPMVYLLKGELAFARGKYSLAYESALRALVFFDEMSLTSKQLETLDLLCRTYMVQGKVRLAKDCGKQYLAVARKKKSGLNVTRAYNSLAFIYGKMGRRDSAMFFANTALELSASTGALMERAKTYDNLHHLHEEWGMDKEALTYFKKYSALRDTLIGQNKSREIAQLQAVQDADRQKKENELLLEKAELQQSELSRKDFEAKMYLVGLFLFLGLGGFAAFSLRRARIANKKLMVLTKEIRESRDKIKKTSDRLGDTNRKLVRIQAALIAQKDTAERASSAKDVFLSSVSHELRTPLTAILGLADELIIDAKSPSERENLEIIKFSGENLLALVNDILDFNKIQSGRIELEYISYDIKSNLGKLVKALKPRARQNGVELIFNYDNRLSEWMVADPVRIGQVINNLLSNAIKFTKDASVTLEVSLEEQRNKDKALVKFAVIDQGIGIPSDKLDHIFERFTQASAETTRKYGGTGLGLAITKRIVELYGSSVQVTSILGKGSTFAFSIELAKGQVPKNKPSFIEEDTLEIPSEINVLLTEDNRVNQKLVVRTFSGVGIDIDVASNGEEALELIEAGKAYDVILMDMHMPKMDGPEATQRIRAMGGKFASMPIIGLSGSTVKEEKELLEMGLTAFLQKPFKKDVLLKLIANSLIASE